MPALLLAREALEEGGEAIRRRWPELALIPYDPSTGEVEGDPSAAEVLFRWWGPREPIRRLLAAAPKLRWAHSVYAGVNDWDLGELARRGILLTNAVGVYGVPIAETVLLYMLMVAKRVWEHRRHQEAHRWQLLEHDELTGRTVGIVGTGSIGREVAVRARAFGMRVLGVRRRPEPLPEFDQVRTYDALRDWLAPQSDFLVLALPLTPQTRGIVDREVLAALPRGAHVINVARGEVLDEGALLDLLRSGHLGGAYLDALSQEPLPADHPFWDLPQVYLTPHNSWSSPRVRERTWALFLENLEAYRQGQPLRNRVDLAAGY